MKDLFRFKQFDVDQAGCTMRINTDGVLLAVSARQNSVSRILDIGTGTGVIALMLAQRFPEAIVEAIDIDEGAFHCAAENFRNSPFSDRLIALHTGIDAFQSEHRFDLIVSNPPFFINSLKNAGEKKSLSRHGSVQFFREMFGKAERYVSEHGSFQLIWPLSSRDQVMALGIDGSLHLHHERSVSSFPDGEAIRVISTFRREPCTDSTRDDFPIYLERGIYTEQYRDLLKPFFIKF
jgi:tRNA1Val (adenine37-N6)-methyltransferase